MSIAKQQTIYKVIFLNDSTICEIYARHVSESELFGFVEVEEFIFRKASAVVLDTAEERLKTEFSGVKRTFIPLTSIIRIDQVEKSGISKAHDVSAKSGSNISQFPVSAQRRKFEINDDKDT